MGLIHGFQAANIFGKVAVCLLLVAEPLNWLCFCMNDWALYDEDSANDDNKFGYGVWRRCDNQEPSPNCVDLDGWRLAWYGAFQGFVIFGFMGVNLAFLFIVLLLFVPQCISNNDMGLLCGVSAIVGTVCYAVALVLFGVKFDNTYDRGYDREILMSGFYLAIIVAILAFIAAICALLGARGGHQVGSTSGAEGGRDEETHHSGTKGTTKESHSYKK